jgi:hypothetical protein
VYVWVFDGNAPLDATLSIDGYVALPNYNTGAVGHWDRLGPYLTTVSNGILLLDYTSNTPGDDVLLSGVEVWREASPPLPPTPTSIVSRKTHSAAGTFDVDLKPPASGIECRTGGATGDYAIVVTFPGPVTVSGNATAKAQVMSGTGEVGAEGVADGNAVTVNGAEVTVNLTDVANAQRLNITIFGVNDGTNSGDVVIPMDVLLGDVTGNGSVNSSDVSATKAQSGAVTNADNFRDDVTVSGLINSSDVSLVKSKSGTALP